MHAEAGHTDARRYGRLIAAGIAVAVVLLLALAVPAVSSGTCGACHTMQPFVTDRSSPGHGGVDCLRCHGGSGLDRLRFATSELPSMYLAALSGRGLTGPASAPAVDRSTCLGCHAATYASTTTDNGLSIRHAVCAATGSCASCHGSAAHPEATRYKQTYVMESCVSCHIAQGAPKACDTCHAGRTERERLAQGPWQVTHGPNWRTTHGSGDLSFCGTCHQPSYCSRCHKVDLPHPADFGTTHGALAKKDPTPCVSCHDRATFCDGCHGLPMPHPADFLVRHPVVAKSPSDPACMRCHEQADCSACHAKHVHPGKTNGTLSGAPLPTVKR